MSDRKLQAVGFFGGVPKYQIVKMVPEKAEYNLRIPKPMWESLLRDNAVAELNAAHPGCEIVCSLIVGIREPYAYEHGGLFDEYKAVFKKEPSADGAPKPA